MRLLSLCAILTTLFMSCATAGPLERFRDCGACPEMIEVPMGSFLMGAPDDEFRQNLTIIVDVEKLKTQNIKETQTVDGPQVQVDIAFGKLARASDEHPYLKEDEGPQHEVTVDIPFAMSKNEITHDQWMACVRDGGCDGYIPSLSIDRVKNGPLEKVMLSGDHPVLYITYKDAQLYVDWLNKKLDTQNYRLPTEAEWEYAARAGTATRFAQGDEVTTDQAAFSGAATSLVLMEDRPYLLSRGFPVPVGQLDAANPWGFRHMSGNASEVTRSCYTKRYEGLKTTSAYLQQSLVDTCKRVLRGGAFGQPMNKSRVAWRRGLRRQAAPIGDDGKRILIGTWKHFGFRILKEITQ